MHYFSGKGCSESLESMHYCIGILNIEIPDEYLVTELFENDEHMIDIIEQLIKK